MVAAQQDFAAAPRAYRHRKLIRFVPVLLLFLIAAVRIAVTYPSTAQAYDEPAHLACGMELLANGTYELETQHPPLTRVAAAALPYLYARWQKRPPMPDKNAPSPITSPIPEWMWIAGNRILGAPPQYIFVLTLARLPGLLFLGIACLGVWLLADYLFGEIVAFWSTALFTSLPVVLAHSSLATTDAGLMAFFVCTIYALLLWIEDPTLKRSVGLGICLGLVVLSKYSAFVFLPACLAGCGVAYLFTGRGRLLRKPGRILISVLVAALIVWAGFRFSTGSIVTAASRPHRLLTHTLGRFPLLYEAGNRIIEAPLPAPELFRGFVWLYTHTKAGHPAYLLGHTSTSGWWYFFPVVLLVKNPLPFLVLSLIGAFLLLRKRASLPWLVFVPVVCALSILAVAMAAKINLGRATFCRPSRCWRLPPGMEWPLCCDRTGGCG